MRIHFCKLFLYDVLLLALVMMNIETAGGAQLYRSSYYSGQRCKEGYYFNPSSGTCLANITPAVAPATRGGWCLSGRRINGRCLTGRPAPA
ncbi:unnamed protein product [Allacma fusca]|uniref:Secreted protein n=1 Tax=Allacma fusca TaxID=39272 RepID=A0A8J2NV67_9HEXA|nr:unnamed protein product [Allacma fusca]